MNYHVQVTHLGQVRYCRPSLDQDCDVPPPYRSREGTYHWWGEADTEEAAIRNAMKGIGK